MGTFIGIYHFQINQMTGYTEFIANAISTHHVTGQTGNIQCLAAVVALDQ